MTAVDEHPFAARPGLPQAVTQRRVIAIARGLGTTAVLSTAAALLDAGVRAIEVTLDSPAALETIRATARRFGDQIQLGAGTVLSRQQADAALAAGASYLVSPHTDPDLIAWAATRGVAALPGAFTPSEVVLAWRAGAAGVKVFPAGPAGADHVQALGGPLSDVPLIPTGGIDAGNAAAFLRAGAVAVGVGGWLVGDGRPQQVTRRAVELLKAVGDATVDGES